jgi:glucose-1-phosphate cytidylyltransferase
VKTVILAGGLGTRLGQETQHRPKPMVEIGGHPIIWHIMNTYASSGFEEFIVALGYKSEVIKDYFINFWGRHSDICVDLRHGTTQLLNAQHKAWVVELIDTGMHTQTGGRIRRLRNHLSNNTFFATYGDGVADIDVAELLRFHRRHGKVATVTAVHAPSRFGELVLEDAYVRHFQEKPCDSGNWINGGFYVFEPEIFDYIASDDTVLELDPMEALVKAGQLAAYKLDTFWHPMDTLRDKNFLEDLWQAGQAPWADIDRQHSRRRAA